MIRMTRATTLVFAALMVMSAAGGSSAWGQSEGAVITGNQAQTHIFQTQAGTVTCTTASFEGTVIGEPPKVTAGDVTMTATYSGCQAFGLNATVQMNGCKYTITGAQPEPLTALVDITGCTAGKQIEVVAGGANICVATVPEQTGLSHVTFANKAGPPEDVDALLTVSGIKYELHGPFCPGGGTTGLRQDGKYTGTSTARAYEDEGTQETTAHGHQFHKVVEGEQIGLWADGGQLHTG